MRFGRYATLADEDIWPADMVGSLHEKLAFSRRPLARGMGPAGYAALLQRPVLAVENAEPLAGTFPLVVIGQGSGSSPRSRWRRSPNISRDTVSRSPRLHSWARTHPWSG
jgi:hypothetical protein